MYLTTLFLSLLFVALSDAKDYCEFLLRDMSSIQENHQEYYKFRQTCDAEYPNCIVAYTEGEITLSKTYCCSETFFTCSIGTFSTKLDLTRVLVQKIVTIP